MTRPERVAQFRRSAGKGWFDTSLCRVGAGHPRDHAIRDWYAREVATHPVCFICSNPFTIERRPASFLIARQQGAARRNCGHRCLPHLLDHHDVRRNRGCCGCGPAPKSHRPQRQMA